ncbi:ABC transporter permease [Lactiplantibacillus daowaiensis]|uniref:ABC transporter permease n=1 Tax=Lactiplantibacillus daowaiensis TaxID=2559918 RepID=A0ABW1RYZ4_9LACO|nr:ABC transporter permease [Lactiplantibacillus daowaiensis]
MILALVKRQLLLYFRDHSGVLFSLMGALIAFVLYLVFLKQTIRSGWTQLPVRDLLLDDWLIGGTLVITSITTTLAGLTQLVADREQQIRADLLQSDVTAIQLMLSYLLSAMFIGLLMQLVMFGVMVGTFAWQDGLTVTGQQVIQLVGLMILASGLATALNAVIINGIRRVASLGSLSALVGTGAGFLVGGLIPIGTLPHFAQLLVKLTPGSYLAALNRQLLMRSRLATSFAGHAGLRQQFETKLGITLAWTKPLTTAQTYLIIGVVLGVALGIVLLPSWWTSRRRQRLLH